MKSILIATLVAFSGAALANLSDLAEKSFVIENLGCATPPADKYSFVLNASFGQYDTVLNLVDRIVGLEVASAAGAPYRFRCTVGYAGHYRMVNGGVEGELERISCYCDNMDARQSEGFCRRYADPFMVEEANAPQAITYSDGVLTTQQLATPKNPLPVCGGTYPVYRFTEK